jgi:hypothetical protein
MEKIAGIGGKAHLYTHPAATDEEAEHDVYVHEEEEQRIGLNDDDGEYVLEVHHDKRHVSSAKSATFNLVNNIIGGGVLVPPPPNSPSKRCLFSSPTTFALTIPLCVGGARPCHSHCDRRA